MRAPHPAAPAVPGLLALLLLAATPSRAEELPLSPRQAWTSEAPALPATLRQPPKIVRLTVHQTETRNRENMTAKDEIAVLRSILKYHRTTPHANNEGGRWGDIAYHYIIGPSGTVYSCRDPQYQSDSATILRTSLAGSITICLMGDFRTAEEKATDSPPTTTPDQHPTPAALHSLEHLLARELRAHGLPPSAIQAHRDLPMVPPRSDCPGGLFYPMLRADVIPAVSRLLTETPAR